MKVVQDDAPKVDFFPFAYLNVSICRVVSDEEGRLTETLPAPPQQKSEPMTTTTMSPHIGSKALSTTNTSPS